MTATWLRPLQTAINVYLKLDPNSANRFQALAPAVITIELLPFAFLFQLEVTTTGIQLHPGELLPAATKIQGTPLQMASVMLDKNNRNAFFAEDLTITGDAELSRQVIELFDDLDIDWEELVSTQIGDTPTYHLKRGIDSIRSFLQQTSERLSDDINEYLHEEIRLFPAPEALKDFYQDVDQIRMQVDRLEARIAALANKKAGGK